MPSTHFDKTDEHNLRSKLAQLQGNDAILSYHQLQGFLFAIACSPDRIRPAEWFDLIWLSDDPQFDDEDQARQFYQQVVRFADYIGELVRQHRYLPFSATYSARWQAELAQWCDGMLIGHQYLEDVWLLALDDLDDRDLDEAVEASLSLANTFADLEAAQQLSFEGGLALTDEHLPEAYEVFWQVLGCYASIAHLWADSHCVFDAEQLFLALEPVARDELCPCGSGLVFAKCCLH